MLNVLCLHNRNNDSTFNSYSQDYMRPELRSAQFFQDLYLVAIQDGL